MKRNLLTFNIIIFIFSFVLWYPNSISANSRLNTQRIRKGTVKIISTFIMPDYYNPWKTKNARTTMGSGAIIGKYLILTNAHIVANTTFLQVQKENDPHLYDAKVLYIDHDCDLALITSENRQFFRGTTTIPIGGIPGLRTKVTTYGYPVGGKRISITEGIVSRIEIGTYAHSGKSSFLKIQTDAAINPGNSGGPVIQNNKVVGLAFQARTKSSNIGFMIPSPIIKHFLDDTKDGRYRGFPSLGIITQELQSPFYRNYLGMRKGQTGIIVTHVITGGSSEKNIEVGDVLLSVGNKSIANDSSISYLDSRIRYTHLIDLKHIGEKIRIKVLRKKQIRHLLFPLKDTPSRITWYNDFNRRPRYFIFGGVLFQPLSKEYLKIWKNWAQRADLRMLYYYFYHMSDNIHPEKKEFVIINRVIPDYSNTYLTDINDKIVNTINGKRILSLKDAVEAAKYPVGKYHIIKTAGTTIPIILRADTIKDADKRIQKKYRIKSLVQLK